MDNTTPIQDIRSVVHQALTDVPDCLAAAVVDTQMGILLAHATAVNLADELMDMMAMALARQLRGHAVLGIERALSNTRYRDDQHSNHFFEELIFFSRNNLHLIQRLASDEDLFFVTVCPNTVPIGMVLIKTHQARDKLNHALTSSSGDRPR